MNMVFQTLLLVVFFYVIEKLTKSSKRTSSFNIFIIDHDKK